MRTLKEQMTNDELLVYFMHEWGINPKARHAEDSLWEAVEEELFLAERLEYYEYCQRLVEFKDWLSSSID